MGRSRKPKRPKRHHTEDGIDQLALYKKIRKPMPPESQIHIDRRDKRKKRFDYRDYLEYTEEEK